MEPAGSMLRTTEEREASVWGRNKYLGDEQLVAEEGELMKDDKVGVIEGAKICDVLRLLTGKSE